MIQSIKININKTTFTLDNDAYNKLNVYVAALQKHFKNEPDVLFDIEARIAELLTLQSTAKGIEIIDANTIDEVIQTIGSIEQLTSAKTTTETPPPPPTNHYYSQPKTQNKLRRNPFNESIGGVCGGIAAYLKIDVSIIRFLFVASLVVFGTGIAIYIILWIVIPKATGEEAEALKEYELNYTNKIYRSKETKAIAGVCSGLALHLGLEIWVVRLAFFIGLFIFGSTFIIYLVAWLIIPFDSGNKQPNKKVDYIEQNNNQVNFIRNLFKAIIAFIAVCLLGFIIVTVFFSAAIFDIFKIDVTYALLKSAIPFETGLEIVVVGALLCLFSPVLFVLAVIAKFAFKANIKIKYAGSALALLFFVGIGLLGYSAIKVIPNFTNKHKYFSTTQATLPKTDSLVFNLKEVIGDKESSFYNTNGFNLQLCDSGLYIPIEYKIRRTLEDSVSFTAKSNHSFSNSEYLDEFLKGLDFENSKNYRDTIRFKTHFFLSKKMPFSFQHISITFYIPEKTKVYLSETSQKVFDVIDYYDHADSYWFTIDEILNRDDHYYDDDKPEKPERPEKPEKEEEEEHSHL
ncbi:MAG: PspC domain-containing protein [Bacteroidota bacterium]